MVVFQEWSASARKSFLEVNVQQMVMMAISVMHLMIVRNSTAIVTKYDL